MQQSTLEISKSWISFAVKGLKNISVYGESYSFKTINDDLIEEIEILQEENSITDIRCILKNIDDINDNILEQVHTKVKIFLVNLYGEYQPILCNFKTQCSGKHFLHALDTELPTIEEVIGFSEDITLSAQYKIEIFKNLFEDKFLTPDKDGDYMLLYHTMTIDNIVTRYLMQYEILLSHVPVGNSKKHLQENVTNYIKNVYNPLHPAEDQIVFHKTRKPGKSYSEDEITYYRNLLGHNDSSADIQVNDKTTLAYSNKLVKVLYFRLTEKEN